MVDTSIPCAPEWVQDKVTCAGTVRYDGDVSELEKVLPGSSSFAQYDADGVHTGHFGLRINCPGSCGFMIYYDLRFIAVRARTVGEVEKQAARIVQVLSANGVDLAFTELKTESWVFKTRVEHHVDLSRVVVEREDAELPDEDRTTTSVKFRIHPFLCSISVRGGIFAITHEEQTHEQVDSVMKKIVSVAECARVRGW